MCARSEYPSYKPDSNTIENTGTQLAGRDPHGRQQSHRIAIFSCLNKSLMQPVPLSIDRHINRLEINPPENLATKKQSSRKELKAIILALNGLSSHKACIYRTTETGKTEKSYTRKDSRINPEGGIYLEAFHEAPRETASVDRATIASTLEA